jgi:uncharacterized Zn finger protein
VLLDAELADIEVDELARAFGAAGAGSQAIALALRALRRPDPPPRPLFRDAARDRLSLARWLADFAESHDELGIAREAAIEALRAQPTQHDFQQLVRLAGIEDAREAILSILQDCESADVSETISILLQLGEVRKAIELLDRRRGFGDERTLTRLAEAAIATAPEWTIEIACRQAKADIARAGRDNYRRASRWLRLAARAYRAAGREADWSDYRTELLRTHRSRSTLVPLIEAIP